MNKKTTANNSSQNIEDEFYQINSDILESFNKFRPPLDIFRYNEQVGRVGIYYKVGGRLTKEQVEELAEMVKEGIIFVSRKDHSIYVKHISYQLDLVLQDKHLTEKEISDIFQMALIRRMESLFDQPVKAVMDKLYEDVQVLVEYLWEDFNRSKAISKRINTEHTLANHSVNTGFLGLALYLTYPNEDMKAKSEKARHSFERAALGFFLHDLGMTKIPAFIRSKPHTLTPDDRGKILRHPTFGYEMLSKLDLKFPEIEQCVLMHHERLNGTGYPQKLSNNIPHLAMLCAIVDSYCAMISTRPWAEPVPPLEAVKLLAEDKTYSNDLTSKLQAFIALTKI